MQLSFTRLTGSYAIARLPADAPLPGWADGPGVMSLTRADDELSIVCAEQAVPQGIEKSGGWAALRIDTLADLDEPGVVLNAVRPISKAGFGVFVMSTFLRDYLLVRDGELERITQLLQEAGHIVTAP